MSDDGIEGSGQQSANQSRAKQTNTRLPPGFTYSPDNGSLILWQDNITLPPCLRSHSMQGEAFDPSVPKTILAAASDFKTLCTAFTHLGYVPSGSEKQASIIKTVQATREAFDLKLESLTGIFERGALTQVIEAQGVSEQEYDRVLAATAGDAWLAKLPSTGRGGSKDSVVSTK